MPFSTIVIVALLVVAALSILYASIKVKANAHLTDIVEQLWKIIDDIDTYSDVAKVDDIAYRQLVENRQKDRWQTGITTDGYGLIIPGLGVRLNSDKESVVFEGAGLDDPTPEADAVAKDYVASGAADELFKIHLEGSGTDKRYLEIKQTPDFISMCAMLAVDPQTVWYDVQWAVLVKQVGDSYEQLNFQFANPTSIDERIADAEQLVASGQNVEVAPAGLSQITVRRLFSLVLEGHYALCDAATATHFCKLTDKSYAYARESL